MRSLRHAFAAATLATATLMTAGCESLLFGIANHGLAPPDATEVFAPDLGLALDVYRPEGASGPAPTVVFFYGGGWQRGERAQYQFVGRRLARNGMLAIIADYRTYPQAQFPAFVDDAARAVAWVRAHADGYGGDPQRLYLAGHSAGAQIAALLGTDARHLERRDVPLDAIDGVIGLSGPYDFAITGEYRKVFGPPAQWPAAQAVNFVDGDEPPFLLIHGTDDRVVEARDSTELADRLRAAGVEAGLVMLPGRGHNAPLLGLYDPDRAPKVMPAIVAFVEDGAR